MYFNKIKASILLGVSMDRTYSLLVLTYNGGKHGGIRKPNGENDVVVVTRSCKRRSLKPELSFLSLILRLSENESRKGME